MASIKTRKRKGGTIGYTAEVRRRGFKPITATFDNLEDANQWAASIEADIKKARISSKAPSIKPDAEPDEWQTIPLSQLIEVSKLLNFKVNPDTDEPDTHRFYPSKYPTVDVFRTAALNELIEWDKAPEYIDALCPVYERYLELVAPMIKAIRRVDPLCELTGYCGYNPADDLFKYSLVFDDTRADPATTREVIDFQFGDECYKPTSIVDIMQSAASAGRIDVIVAIGLANEYTGQDRYQKLLDERRADLGKINFKYVEWAENVEYAAKIHPLMPKMFNRDSLKILDDCKNHMQFSGFTMAFHGKDAVATQDREYGDKFRAWFRRNDTAENRVIMTEILGLDIDKLLSLGSPLTAHHLLLGVAANATKTQIKAAYKKLAMAHHPDRGGDTEQFKKIQKAYDSLVA